MNILTELLTWAWNNLDKFLLIAITSEIMIMSKRQSEMQTLAQNRASLDYQNEPKLRRNS